MFLRNVNLQTDGAETEALFLAKPEVFTVSSPFQKMFPDP